MLRNYEMLYYTPSYKVAVCIYFVESNFMFISLYKTLISKLFIHIFWYKRAEETLATNNLKETLSCFSFAVKTESRFSKLLPDWSGLQIINQRIVF